MRSLRHDVVTPCGRALRFSVEGEGVEKTCCSRPPRSQLRSDGQSRLRAPRHGRVAVRGEGAEAGGRDPVAAEGTKGRHDHQGAGAGVDGGEPHECRVRADVRRQGQPQATTGLPGAAELAGRRRRPERLELPERRRLFRTSRLAQDALRLWARTSGRTYGPANAVRLHAEAVAAEADAPVAFLRRARGARRRPPVPDRGRALRQGRAGIFPRRGDSRADAAARLSPASHQRVTPVSADPRCATTATTPHPKTSLW